MKTDPLSQVSLDRRSFLMAAGAGMLAAMTGRFAKAQAAGNAAPAAASARPNVIIILADDMGYGDVSCYDPEHCKIPTPCIDQLARQGMRFTDAHTTSPVCSPSRYGLLTGRYHWRAGIRAALPKWHGPAIPPQRLTMAQMLKDQGYHTACIGKWHLGFEWPRTNGKLDFTKPITGGPRDRGFDYYFGVDVPNFPPFTWIENDRVTVLPTEHQVLDKEMIVNHEGPKAPGWRFDRIVPTLVEKSAAYIQEQAATDRPFFLFLSLTSPHYPIAPSEQFRGKSGINPLADFIMETDAVVGAVSDALDRAGIAENTILLFLTDNGHDPVPGLEPFERAGHRVSGPLSGRKFTIAEGGHRVPFVMRWPRVIEAGSVCDEPICTTDLMATLAAITGASVPDSAAEDSVSILPLLHGQSDGYEHPAIVHHAPDNALAIRQGDWKLTFPPPDAKDGAKPVLHNLREDIGETQDRLADHPEIAAGLAELLRRYITDGRSTPGEPQKNDVNVPVPTLPA